MGGGKSPKYPGPSASEQALQTQQAANLAQQQQLIAQGQKENQLLAPYLYRSMGLIPQLDASGAITGFTEDPDFAAQQATGRALQTEQLDAQRQALKLQQEQHQLSTEAQRRQMDMSEKQYELALEQQGWSREQITEAREQRRRQNLMDPFLYESMGLTPSYDETGTLTGFSKIADPLAEQGKEIQRLQNERSLAALKGELPVNPALLRELSGQETSQRETMRRQLGAGWEQSTPGQESLANLGRYRTEALETARRGDLTLAEQLSGSREQTNRAQEQYRYGQLTGRGAQALAQGGSIAQPSFPNFPITSTAGTPDYFSQQRGNMMGAAQIPFQSAAQANSLYSGFQQNLGTLGEWRGQQFQGAVSKAQAKQAEQAGYGQMAGAALAAGAAAAVAASSRHLKREILELSPEGETQTLREIMGVA